MHKMPNLQGGWTNWARSDQSISGLYMMTADDTDSLHHSPFINESMTQCPHGRAYWIPHIRHPLSSMSSGQYAHHLYAAV